MARRSKEERYFVAQGGGCLRTIGIGLLLLLALIVIGALL